MADAEAEKSVVEENSSKTITIFVKTPKEKKEFVLDPNDTVKKLKELVSEKFGSPEEQICLIFAGKILKNDDTLSSLSITDGMTVHLVIKSANRTAATTDTPPPPTATTQGSGTLPSQQPDVSATPFGLGSLGGLAGIGNIGMGSANFMEMQQRMQREVLQNPDMLRQMMENPFVQQMMSSPDVMRQLMTSNPQMRELMERNPEITHMLNNPELMRQTMELARNPAMLQELMRTQDRAMSNLESIPGGFNALQRMYTDIQEPMMNAAQEGFGSNPFAGLVGSGSGTAQSGRENTDPLPNPWAPRSTTQSSTSTTTTSSTTSSSGGQSGMFNTPGMSSLLGQMSQNPQLMQNMLQAPYMQAMLESMSSNPQLAEQILSTNPMFTSNPELRQQFVQSLPQLTQQLQNPEMQNVFTNPRALQAIMQIQQGMQSLQTEAPGLFPGMGLAGMPSMPAGPSTTRASTTTATTATPVGSPQSLGTTTTASTGDTTTTTSTTTTTTTGSTLPQTPGGFDPTTNLMSQLFNMMSQGNATAPPEQRYSSQLEQLAMMGFVDRDANIRALQATLGDVNAAIDRLLSQR